MIAIVPIGEIKIDYIEKAKIYLEELYNEKGKIYEKIPLNEKCFEKKREQYKASCLLKKAKNFKADKVLYICDVDIYMEKYNFVFGIAEYIGAKKCLVSITRLKESFYGKKDDENLLIIRTAKEIIHEVGHLKGLDHCPDKKCIMHFSTTILDTDFKDCKICKECINKINKMN